MKRVLSLALTFFCLALWSDEVLFQEKGEFSMPIQANPDNSLYWIRRPLDEDEWRETLEQVLR